MASPRRVSAGAVIFRLPIADRPKRAALPAEERLFWAVIISVVVSTTLAFALAGDERVLARTCWARAMSFWHALSVLARRLAKGAAAVWRPSATRLRTWTALLTGDADCARRVDVFRGACRLSTCSADAIRAST